MIELTKEELETLARRKRERQAHAQFGAEMEIRLLSQASNKKLRNKRARKRIIKRAKFLSQGPARDSKTRRVDAYINAERQGFYSSRAWHMLRYKALSRAQGKCELCGSTGELQVDHIKPRSKHPKLALVLDNLQVLCLKCNQGKGAWDESDWRSKTLADEGPPA